MCLDFTFDPLRDRLKFMPSVGYTMSFGPMSASPEGVPTPPEFEIDLQRGKLHLAGNFKYEGIGFAGVGCDPSRSVRG
jgi:hypothetical protein